MAFCTIARDQNKEIQEVYAPNEEPSILFKDILESLGGYSWLKEDALKIWARAYTPTFKNTFVIITKAKTWMFISSKRTGNKIASINTVLDNIITYT